VGLPSSPVEFSSLRHSHKLSHSWLLGAPPTPARASLAHLACLLIVPGRVPFPQSSALSAPHLLSCVSYLFLLLITHFLFFFPGWRSVCPGGYAALAQACLWEYRGTAKLTWSASSQAVWALVTGGLGALLVSPFNVKWRFSALAGGVEGSKLCLFSVIMPAKCVSGVSPRFHYWRLALCFLPLATILESLIFLIYLFKNIYYLFLITQLYIPIFLMVLGFDIRASCWLGRHSATWATLPTQYLYILWPLLSILPISNLWSPSFYTLLLWV
jgi:hypothetical protein